MQAQILPRSFNYIIKTISAKTSELRGGERKLQFQGKLDVPPRCHAGLVPDLAVVVVERLKVLTYISNGGSETKAEGPEHTYYKKTQNSNIDGVSVQNTVLKATLEEIRKRAYL